MGSCRSNCGPIFLLRVTATPHPHQRAECSHNSSFAQVGSIKYDGWRNQYVLVFVFLATAIRLEVAVYTAMPQKHMHTSRGAPSSPTTGGRLVDIIAFYCNVGHRRRGKADLLLTP